MKRMADCHPDKVYYAKGLCHYCYHAKSQKANAEARAKYRREYHLTNTYGITSIEFEALVIAQSGACAICRQEPQQLFVDHSHSTGDIRGLLCSKCNLILGQVEDSVEWLEAFIEYLRRSSC